jgi:hypothetical protein
VRDFPRRFLVLAGHELADIETVVSGLTGSLLLNSRRGMRAGGRYRSAGLTSCGAAEMRKHILASLPPVARSTSVNSSHASVMSASS